MIKLHSTKYVQMCIKLSNLFNIFNYIYTIFIMLIILIMCRANGAFENI